MKYPLENLHDAEFEKLVALICERILGMGTIVFSEGKDGGKDAKFHGKANKFPSESTPWDGKIIIQAKHIQRPNASCSDSDFPQIIKNNVLPAISVLEKNNEIDYYLLFTNRKLTGMQDAKLEDIFDEGNLLIKNRLIGLERINLWLQEYPDIPKALNLNMLLLPLDFNEEDLKNIIHEFSNGVKAYALPDIPEVRDIEKKNVINRLSKEYFDNSIKKNLQYFEQIRLFLQNPINEQSLRMYQNTIGDLNDEIIIYRNDYGKFEVVINHIYKLILCRCPELQRNRGLIRIFLHYMYYNCDIGENE